MPDYLKFKEAREAQRKEFMHSAKGSTWKDHLYKAKETVGGKVRYVYATASAKKVGGSASSSSVDRVRMSKLTSRKMVEDSQRERDIEANNNAVGRKEQKDYRGGSGGSIDNMEKILGSTAESRKAQQVVYDGLTPKEKEYLDALAERIIRALKK